MAETTKYAPINGGNLVSEFRGFFSLPRTKRTTTLAYGFVLAFILFTVFIAFGPSSNSSSPWFTNVFASSNSSSAATVFSEESYRSQFSSIFPFFFPNATVVPVVSDSSRSSELEDSSGEDEGLKPDQTGIDASDSDFGGEVEVLKPNQSTIATPKSEFSGNGEVLKPNQSTIGSPPGMGLNPNQTPVVAPPATGLNPNQTTVGAPPVGQNPSTIGALLVIGMSPNQSTVGAPPVMGLDPNQSTVGSPPVMGLDPNQSTVGVPPVMGLNPNQSTVGAPPVTGVNPNKSTVGAPPVMGMNPNQSTTGALKYPAKASTSGSEDKRVSENSGASNFPSLLKKGENGTSGVPSVKNPVEDLMNCNLFDGEWVRDESYPLYNPGSCPLIDEQFNCFINGRPDSDYYKLKWKPKGCSLPRLNGTHMLELLRGKRLVFVGDSLNRNMWESLVCILRSSVKDHSKVYEASGRHNFRSEPSYSFVFKDYGATVEFFVSPFLVQEWETPDKNGTEKETLRLDLIGRAADQYKKADVLIFNTGHWWTHPKTSEGKDYYQEGSHVYSELNVIEAFRKALTTWARWVDANVDAVKKTMVLFRGYSASHFSGGQWNSGGACDSETEPIKNATYLAPYPPMMYVLESVLKGMKTHVSYLNITRITDYRKDGHPSVYRKQKQHVPESERKSPLRFQDCSHWCLPGVPDAWNELLYAEILIKQHQREQSQKKP